MPNFTTRPLLRPARSAPSRPGRGTWRTAPAGRSRPGSAGRGAGCRPAGREPCARARAAGSSSAGSNGSASKQVPVRDRHRQGAGQEGGVGQRLVLALHGGQAVEDVRPARDERLVAGGEVVEAPQAPGEGPGLGLAPHGQAIGGRLRDVLGDPELGGDAGDVLAPVVRADVEAVVDRGAAEATEALAQGVAGGAPGLGDGERHQVPAAVPVAPFEVLLAGLHGADAHRRQGSQPGVGRQVRGPLAGPLALEQALGHQAAQARAHLLGRPDARLGDGERVGRRDRAVVAGDPEHEHAGGQVAVAERPDGLVGRGWRRRPCVGPRRVGRGRISPGRSTHDRESRRPLPGMSMPREGGMRAVRGGCGGMFGCTPRGGRGMTEGHGM